MPFPRSTQLVHDWVSARVHPGDWVVDATAGNGNDTEFLAELVGPAGKVYAFDVQKEAIEETRSRLDSVGMLDRVELIEAGHETLLPRLNDCRRLIRAVMFNLGYLPGSDKLTITAPETTIYAVELALNLLQPGGLVTLVLYVGHDGGKNEADAVLEFCRSLDPKEYRAYRAESLNYSKPPPFAVGIERI